MTIIRKNRPQMKKMCQLIRFLSIKLITRDVSPNLFNSTQLPSLSVLAPSTLKGLPSYFTFEVFLCSVVSFGALCYLFFLQPFPSFEVFFDTVWRCPVGLYWCLVPFLMSSHQSSVAGKLVLAFHCTSYQHCIFSYSPPLSIFTSSCVFLTILVRIM